MKTTLEFEWPEEKSEYVAALGEINAVRAIGHMFDEMLRQYRELPNSEKPKFEEFIKRVGKIYEEHQTKLSKHELR